MSDATGEPADRFHFLRLAELLLQGAAFGYVFGEQFEDELAFLSPTVAPSAGIALPERRTWTGLPSFATHSDSRSLKGRRERKQSATVNHCCESRCRLARFSPASSTAES